jgi:hypothetical protein
MTLSYGNHVPNLPLLKKDAQGTWGIFMPKERILRQISVGKGFIIRQMGRVREPLFRVSAIILAAMFFFLAPTLWAQDQSPAAEENMSGESCLYLKQQRRDTCKKSAETCTDVHRLDALNLIKTCAQLAQECDLLGSKEDVTCQPGGNGQVTLHH